MKEKIEIFIKSKKEKGISDEIIIKTGCLKFGKGAVTSDLIDEAINIEELNKDKQIPKKEGESKVFIDPVTGEKIEIFSDEVIKKKLEGYHISNILEKDVAKYLKKGYDYCETYPDKFVNYKRVSLEKDIDPITNKARMLIPLFISKVEYKKLMDEEDKNIVSFNNSGDNKEASMQVFKDNYSI